MKLHKVIHKQSGQVIGEKVELATSLIRRSVGLMFRSTMGEVDGVIIENTNSVHTCFMRFPMDAVFLSRDNTIIKIIRRMKTWRFTWIYWRAVRVLEFEGGVLPESVREGDTLEVTLV